MGTSGERTVANSPGLTERQQKWFASVEASLERDTGKTLDEWVAIARTCPHDKPKARADWLREHHGLGVNRCAHVLSVAFPGAMGWDEPDALRTALWKDPQSEAICQGTKKPDRDLSSPTAHNRSTSQTYPETVSAIWSVFGMAKFATGPISVTVALVAE